MFIELSCFFVILKVSAIVLALTKRGLYGVRSLRPGWGFGFRSVEKNVDFNMIPEAFCVLAFFGDS